ncbi:histone deacetylase complex protein [Cytidiella melzeri]|nr:histone deacetylase complex protein [Cytidiella melzeri]
MSHLQTELTTNGEPPEISMDIDFPQHEKPVSYTSKQRPHSEGRRASSVPAKRQRQTEPRVGYVYDDRMLMHTCLAPDGHPEQPERLTRVYSALASASVLTNMKRIPIREVERKEVLLVHSQTLWDKVMAIAAMSEQDIFDSAAYYTDLSLYVNPRTPYCAKLSCGGVIEATLAVARGSMNKTFAMVRPPGHHSEPDEHMGFCFFNNVAVAAKVVQHLTPIKRILILDWDVHHGNGTQRAFYDDPTVLYISLHRYENGTYYPNGPFGSMTSCGDGPGQGFSVNIPWPNAGMGDADYLHAFQHVIMPIAMEFAPELVIISAGFDAARGDDLGECDVTPEGYAHMTHMLSGLANGKLVVALEGGYSLDAISTSSLAVAKVLLGEAPPQLEPMIASVEATETVFQVAMHQSQWWKSLNPKKLEPREDIEEISFSIPELLKAHRQDYLFRTYDMLQVPFVAPALEDRFSSQVTCTADIMTNEILVVFVHEFGNLRAELGSALTCDLHMEHSYLVDYSKKMIDWITQQGYALLDVNVYPKPFQTSATSKHDYSAELIVYLWDNYIQLTEARKIVLIGHGPGCQTLMHLLNNRTISLMRFVKGIIQVVGNYNVPSTPENPELRVWYYDRSAVFLPSGHRLFANTKVLKKHGLLHDAEESQPIKLLIKAFNRITTYIPEMLNDSFALRLRKSGP